MYAADEKLFPANKIFFFFSLNVFTDSQMYPSYLKESCRQTPSAHTHTESLLHPLLYSSLSNCHTSSSICHLDCFYCYSDIFRPSLSLLYSGEITETFMNFTLL